MPRTVIRSIIVTMLHCGERLALVIRNRSFYLLRDYAGVHRVHDNLVDCISSSRSAGRMFEGRITQISRDLPFETSHASAKTIDQRCSDQYVAQHAAAKLKTTRYLRTGGNGEKDCGEKCGIHD